MDDFSRRDVPPPREDPLHRLRAHCVRPARTREEIEAAIAGFRGRGGEVVRVKAIERPPEQTPLLRNGNTRDLTVAVRLLLIEALKIKEGDEFEHEALGRVKIHKIGDDGRVIYQRMDTEQIMSGWASTLALLVNGRRVAEIIGWREGEECKISLENSRQQLIAAGLLESKVS